MSVVNDISEWLTMPTPSLGMTIHTLSRALFALCVDTLFLLPNKFGFLFPPFPSLGEGNVLFTLAGPAKVPFQHPEWQWKRQKQASSPVCCDPSPHPGQTKARKQTAGALNHSRMGQTHIFVGSGGSMGPLRGLTHLFPVLSGW